MKSLPKGYDDIEFLTGWFHKLVVATEINLLNLMPSWKSKFATLQLNESFKLKLHLFKSLGEQKYHSKKTKFNILSLLSMWREIHQPMSIQSYIV